MSQGSAAASLSDDSRQSGYDRRRRPTPLLSRFTFKGRRRAGRRTEESRNVYVDRFTATEWMLAAGIMVLSLLDLVFTLAHLDAGGREARNDELA